VFILEHYIALNSFSATSEAFSNAYHDKEVSNKTPIGNNISGHRKCLSVTSVHRATKQLTLWQRRFKQCIGYNDGIGLQEFNIAIGFDVLCVKELMCSSQGCVLNGTLCTSYACEKKGRKG
jgi:hypothetical protein